MLLISLTEPMTRTFLFSWPAAGGVASSKWSTQIILVVAVLGPNALLLENVKV